MGWTLRWPSLGTDISLFYQYESIAIFADGRLEVCDGAHWVFVMKETVNTVPEVTHAGCVVLRMQGKPFLERCEKCGTAVTSIKGRMALSYAPLRWPAPFKKLPVDSGHPRVYGCAQFSDKFLSGALWVCFAGHAMCPEFLSSMPRPDKSRAL